MSHLETFLTLPTYIQEVSAENIKHYHRRRYLFIREPACFDQVNFCIEHELRIASEPPLRLHPPEPKGPLRYECGIFELVTGCDTYFPGRWTWPVEGCLRARRFVSIITIISHQFPSSTGDKLHHGHL